MHIFYIENKLNTIALLAVIIFSLALYAAIPFVQPSKFAIAKPSGADWSGDGGTSCGCACNNEVDYTGNHTGGVSREPDGEGGQNTYTPPPPPPPPAPTLVFTADDYRIPVDSNTGLSWDSEHAVSCTASGGTDEWSGVKDADGNGSSGILTLDSATFTLTCTGRGGTISKDVTIQTYKIDNPEYCGDNICSVSESCSSCEVDCGVCAGEYCGDNICQASIGETCSTCSNDCGACTGSGPEDDDNPNVDNPDSDDTTTTITTFDSTYPSLTFWPSGSARTTKTKTINKGDTVYLDWDTTNSVRCTAGPGWSGTMATSGRNVSAGVLTSDAFFGLACYDSLGRDDYKTVSVNVLGGSLPLKIVSFEVYPPIVRSGGSAILSWELENATACNITMTGDATFVDPGSFNKSSSVNISDIKSELLFKLNCTKVDNTFTPPDITTERQEVKVKLAPSWLEQ